MKIRKLTKEERDAQALIASGWYWDRRWFCVDNRGHVARRAESGVWIIRRASGEGVLL